MTNQDDQKSLEDTESLPTHSEVTPLKTHISVKEGLSKMEINRYHQGVFKIATTPDSIHVSMAIIDDNSDGRAQAYVELSPEGLNCLHNTIQELIDDSDSGATR